MNAPAAGGRFVSDALEVAYRALDELPVDLRQQAIVNSRGTAAARCDDLAALRRALLAGEPLPEDAAAWPLAPAAAAFREAILGQGLAALARHNEAVTDQVLLTLLWHSDRIVDYPEEGDAAIARAVRSFRAEWQSLAAEIGELLSAFDVLGDTLKANNWGITRGLLHSEAWQELVRIRKMLETMSELRTLIRQLGRAQATDQVDWSRPPQLQVMTRTRSHLPVSRAIHLPGLVAETHGVVRGGSIARMLPAEAVLLRLPKLRLIWFARLVEQSLLVYEDEDRLEEISQVDSDEWQPDPNPRPQMKLEAGPMVLCVDTSASMKGGAENVAKAVVLEAMRCAAGQRRRCYVYAFGGPDEVIERELPVDARGVEAMLAFLSQGFHGGTDIGAPLARALERIGDDDWRFADLLIASDGEFGATPELAGQVERAKREQGLRVQGILIGDRETIGMAALCDDVFWVGDWRRFGGGAGDLPVETRHLTSLYFPGALTRPSGGR